MRLRKFSLFYKKKKIKFINIKMEYTKEQLLENLPDYINKKIDDNELIKAIEYEISTNQNFKKEFDLLNSTFVNLKKLEFSEPPTNYFYNFLPKLNEKIYENSKSYKLGFNLSKFWKYAVPVVTIILFFIGYKTIFKNNEYINNLNNDSQIVIKELNYSDDKNFSSKNDSEPKSENKEEIINSKNENTFKNNIKSRDFGKKISTKNEDFIFDINDTYSEEEIFFSDDDLNFDNKFEKMTSEEQNNLIDKIKNSNL